jgi:hypothetical protein
MSPKNNSTTADRFPMWPGSPVLRVLSVSLTSTRSSDPSHLVGLAGPASLRVNRMDLSCSRWFLWLHAGGTTPGSTSDRSRCRGLRFRLPPLRDRVGYSDHDRFRGYFHSGLQPPRLRFATAVTGRRARLSSQLLARLCRSRRFRRQTSTRLQGATPTPPHVRVAYTAVRQIEHGRCSLKARSIHERPSPDHSRSAVSGHASYSSRA